MAAVPEMPPDGGFGIGPEEAVHGPSGSDPGPPLGGRAPHVQQLRSGGSRRLPSVANPIRGLHSGGRGRGALEGGGEHGCGPWEGVQRCAAAD